MSKTWFITGATRDRPEARGPVVFTAHDGAAPSFRYIGKGHETRVVGVYHIRRCARLVDPHHCGSTAKLGCVTALGLHVSVSSQTYSQKTPPHPKDPARGHTRIRREWLLIYCADYHCSHSTGDQRRTVWR